MLDVLAVLAIMALPQETDGQHDMFDCDLPDLANIITFLKEDTIRKPVVGITK
jgi:hypothetical protein